MYLGALATKFKQNVSRSRLKKLVLDRYEQFDEKCKLKQTEKAEAENIALLEELQASLKGITKQVELDE